MQLANSAVDEDHVRPQLLALHSAAVSAGNDFPQAGVVVDAGDGLDAEPAVAALEGPAVDELHHRANGLAAADVGDIEALDDADGLV